MRHRPERPSPRSPIVPPPPSAFSSDPPPWITGRWQGDSRSEHYRGIECRIRGTVGWGGGGVPPPKLPHYKGHASGENVPAYLSSLPRVLDNSQPGSSAVLPRLVRTSGTSAVPLQGGVADQLRLPSAALPCYALICPASNPSAISSPHSLR